MSETYGHDSWECPICLKQRRRPPDHKRLYNALVCRKCRNGFANRRQAAYLVDVVLFRILVFALAFISGLFLAGTSGTIAPAAVTVPAGPATTVAATQVSPAEVVLGIMLLVLLPFLFSLRDAYNGRSPGKWLFGLQVVDAQSREPIGWAQSFKRNLILAIPYVNWIGVIGGLLTMMKGRRWGDEWAQTEIVWLKYRTREPFAPAGRYCRVCGYDLTGNVSGRCPECGTEIRNPELLPQPT